MLDWQWIRSSAIIYLLFSSSATTFLNGFTLFVIYKDPLKCFRNPLKTHFIKTFTMNLIIGLVGEPLIAFWHIKATFDVRVSWIFADGLGLMVLSIAAVQLSAVDDAMDIYQPLAAKRLLIVSLVNIGIDFVTSTLLLTNGREFKFIHALGIFLYGEVNLIILIIILIANWKAFLGRAGLQADSLVDEFFKGTIIITLILLPIALPFLLVNTIIDINRIMNGDHNPRLVGFILSYIMLLKFLLDPLVFIFRVPTYRRAVRIVCVECGRVDNEQDDATSSLTASIEKRTVCRL